MNKEYYQAEVAQKQAKIFIQNPFLRFPLNIFYYVLEQHCYFSDIHFCVWSSVELGRYTKVTVPIKMA